MIDNIKETLAFFRGIFLLLIATIFSLIAYIFTTNLDWIHFFLSIYILIVLIVFEIFLFFLIIKNLNKLKELSLWSKK